MGKESNKNDTKHQEESNKIKFQRAIELFNQGLNFYEIAEIVNISKIHLVRSFPKRVLLERIASFLPLDPLQSSRIHCFHHYNA